MPSLRNWGFTPIELLVVIVIAIIAVVDRLAAPGRAGGTLG
jgi:Tfp pilus assembly protein FimT